MNNNNNNNNDDDDLNGSSSPKKGDNKSSVPLKQDKWRPPDWGDEPKKVKKPPKDAQKRKQSRPIMPIARSGINDIWSDKNNNYLEKVNIKGKSGNGYAFGYGRRPSDPEYDKNHPDYDKYRWKRKQADIDAEDEYNRRQEEIQKERDRVAREKAKLKEMKELEEKERKRREQEFIDMEKKIKRWRRWKTT